MVHGIAKWSHDPANFGKLLQQIGAPLPTQMAWLVTLLETFGGLAILLGLR
jgi:putative oxidoreductase